MRTFSTLGLVIGFSAVVCTVLFMLTPVLAMTGATDVSMWTGTIGAVLLAVWLVAINIRRRPARTAATPEDSGDQVDGEVDGEVSAGLVRVSPGRPMKEADPHGRFRQGEGQSRAGRW